MNEIYRGTHKALIFPDYVDSEQLHPASYFSLDSDRVKDGLFKGMSFNENLETDGSFVIVAGRNFGCGSSREVIIQALILNGFRFIIAESFARIFYRNAINNGMYLLESENIRSKIVSGDMLNINIDESGRIQVLKEGNILLNMNAQDRFVELVESNWSKSLLRMA